jgi:hypothetical protein
MLIGLKIQTDLGEAEIRDLKAHEEGCTAVQPE